MIQLALGILVIGFDPTREPKKLESAKSLAHRFQNIPTCSEYSPRLTVYLHYAFSYALYLEISIVL